MCLDAPPAGDFFEAIAAAFDGEIRVVLSAAARPASARWQRALSRSCQGLKRWARGSTAVGGQAAPPLCRAKHPAAGPRCDGGVGAPGVDGDCGARTGFRQPLGASSVESHPAADKGGQ
eukprot:3074414-Pyramimonas_sp.AAC.1